MTASHTPASTEAAQQTVEDIVREAAPAVLAYLTRRVSDHADAADLLGDVLLVVWRRIDTMPTDPQMARMWMFGIARKVLATGLRSDRRRHALTERLRHELTTADLLGANSVPPDGPTEGLTSALDRLRRQDREMPILIHWDSFTLTEAAQHLRLRNSTARSRYHRARLKQFLENQDSTETP